MDIVVRNAPVQARDTRGIRKRAHGGEFRRVNVGGASRNGDQRAFGWILRDGTGRFAEAMQFYRYDFTSLKEHAVLVARLAVHVQPRPGEHVPVALPPLRRLSQVPAFLVAKRFGGWVFSHGRLRRRAQKRIAFGINRRNKLRSSLKLWRLAECRG